MTNQSTIIPPFKLWQLIIFGQIIMFGKLHNCILFDLFEIQPNIRQRLNMVKVFLWIDLARFINFINYTIIIIIFWFNKHLFDPKNSRKQSIEINSYAPYVLFTYRRLWPTTKRIHSMLWPISVVFIFCSFWFVYP